MSFILQRSADSEGFAIPPPKKRRATECQTAAEEGTFETGSQGKGEGRTKSDGSQLSTVSRTAPLPEQPQRAGEDADARERPLTVETAAGQGCNRSIGGAPSRDSRDLPDSIVASHPKAADGDAKMESPHGTAEAGGPNGAREAETPTSAVVESALESEGQACDGTMGSTGEKAAENPEQKTVDKTGEGSAEIVGKPGGGAAGPPVEDKRPPGARSPLKHPIDLKKITYDDLVGRSHEIGPGGDYILLEKMRDMGEPESTVRVRADRRVYDPGLRLREARQLFEEKVLGSAALPGVPLRNAHVACRFFVQWMRIMIEGMAPIERLQGRAGTSSSIPAQRPRPPPPPPRAPRAQVRQCSERHHNTPLPSRSPCLRPGPVDAFRS